MPDTYKTIGNSTEGLYKEKGSKFFAFAYPLSQLEDSDRLIGGLKKKYHDARHHCYAYRFGADGSRFRANDDNEPSYTAGKPILGQIDSFGLTNVMVVVVRYFGGTLLGKGGLITAYKAATHDALSKAMIIEKTVDDHFQITCGYEELNWVLRTCKEFGIEPEKQDFQMNCMLQVAIRKSIAEQLLHKIEIMENTSIKYLYTV